MVICIIVAFIGLLYTYLAEGTGNQSTGHGALQAFQHRHNHWASGCLSHLELNYKHSLFCHVRCFMTPSMKPGVYHMYVLLAAEGEVCRIKKEKRCWIAMYYMFHLILKCSFIFNRRKSTACTHVLGLFHTLVSLAPTQFQATPSITDDIELPLPITLYTCK